MVELIKKKYNGMSEKEIKDNIRILEKRKEICASKIAETQEELNNREDYLEYILLSNDLIYLKTTFTHLDNKILFLNKLL